jgi:phosphopantothenoylcysteine decarboxylase/phosphopantothenate--cysteine ligase
MLSGKKIIVGVTGGIAAYKSCELVRRLISLNAEVVVIMTSSAQKFVTPLTFESLSRSEVITDMFPPDKFVSTRHIDLAQWPDLFVVVPATANIIGKIRGGIADDMLSTVLISTIKPVLICPAMNVKMYENPMVQENIKYLTKHGYKFLEPEVGDLACRDVGKGRMPEPPKIVDEIVKLLGIKQDLKGLKILVTAGGTYEPIDPVRVITNRSTGKMGFALAKTAKSRGAEVTLICGQTTLPSPERIKTETALTSDEMLKKVKAHFKECDVLLMAAAVSDYRAKDISDKKLKKEAGGKTLELIKTKDILAEVAKEKGKRIVVGFSLETEQAIENAKDKMRAKNLDMVVVNSPEAIGAEENKVTLLVANGRTKELPKMAKEKVAEGILDEVGRMVSGK